MTAYNKLRLTDSQLFFLRDLNDLCRKALDLEYNTGVSEGLSPTEIGNIVYNLAVTNPVLVLETFEALVDIPDETRKLSNGKLVTRSSDLIYTVQDSEDALPILVDKDEGDYLFSMGVPVK